MSSQLTVPLSRKTIFLGQNAACLNINRFIKRKARFSTVKCLGSKEKYAHGATPTNRIV
jgi:hypothetical protein